VVTFELGSAICGAAPTMNAMIFGRVIAGIGGAGMYLGYVSFPIRFYCWIHLHHGYQDKRTTSDTFILTEA
jgi:MFS family permease